MEKPLKLPPGFDFMNDINVTGLERISILEKMLKGFKKTNEYNGELYVVLNLFDYYRFNLEGDERARKMAPLVEEYYESFCEGGRFSFFNEKEYEKAMIIREKAFLVKIEKTKESLTLAIGIFMKSVELFKESSQRFLLEKDIKDMNDVIPNYHKDFCHLYYDISDCYGRLGNLQQQLEFCNLALEQVRKSRRGNTLFESMATFTISVIYYKMDPENSRYNRLIVLLHFLKRMRTIERNNFSSLDRIKGEIECLEKIADVLFDEHFWKMALKLHEKTLEMRNEMERVQSICHEQNNASLEIVGRFKRNHKNERCETTTKILFILFHLQQKKKMKRYIRYYLSINEENGENDPFFLTLMEDIKQHEIHGDRTIEKKVPNNKCKFCNKNGSKKLRKCANCKLFYYCSKEHQKKDWKEHKKYCVSLFETLVD